MEGTKARRHEGTEGKAAEPKPKRRDQFQCTHCKAWGCPVEGGTRSLPVGIYRYRRCKNAACSMNVFKTFQPHGGVERVLQ